MLQTSLLLTKSLNKTETPNFRGGLPPPDLLFRISTISSAEKYLPNTYLKYADNAIFCI